MNQDPSLQTARLDGSKRFPKFLAAAIAPVALLTACASGESYNGDSKMGTRVASNSAVLEAVPDSTHLGTSVDLVLPTPDANGDPAEQAAYWANGASDGYADDSDLRIAEDYAKVAEDNGSRGDEAREAISAGAEKTAAYWANGASDGYADDSDLRIAEDYAEIAEDNHLKAEELKQTGK